MSFSKVERVDGVPIVHIEEDIDASNSAATGRRLADALGPDALSLIVDLGGARYLDSAGIDMLLRFGERLDRRRARLILVIPADSRLNRLAEIVGLADTIRIHPAIPAALKDVNS